VTYYDLTAKPREGFGFDDLVRRLRTEFPYHLTPTSPPHGDRRAVCESATRNRRTRSMACRWTGARCYAAVSTNILHRRQCSNRVDTSLISCKIARCVAVSPSYAPAHSGFRERVLAIRGGVKRPTIAASEVNAVLRPLPVRPTRVRWSGAPREDTSARGPRSERPSRVGCHAAALRDGHVSHDADRLASTRARRAAAVRDVRSAGTASPVAKYISSGVCPRNAEWGSTVLYSWT
jgi:hypothetical protein